MLIKWLITSLLFTGLLETFPSSSKILKEMPSHPKIILKRPWPHSKARANLMKTLRKRIKLENFWLPFSKIEIASRWFARWLMKPDSKIWTAFLLKTWDLNSSSKWFTSERESHKALKSRLLTANNWMVTCTVTWFHRMSLPSTTGPFQTLKTLGITCASNNAKKSKMIVRHCLTKSFGTIWNSQLKKIISTQLAKMLLKCAWWITEKRRSDKWFFPWNMRRNSRRELRRR